MQRFARTRLWGTIGSCMFVIGLWAGCAEPIDYAADEAELSLTPDDDEDESTMSGPGTNDDADPTSNEGTTASAPEDRFPMESDTPDPSEPEPALDAGGQEPEPMEPASAGAGGSSGTGEETGGAAGAGGGTEPSAPPTIGACDFSLETTDCAAFACETCNPDQYNTYCGMACQTLFDCVKTNDCSTEEDPFCSIRIGESQLPNLCTGPYDSGGGATGEPVLAAGALLECVCSG